MRFLSSGSGWLAGDSRSQGSLKLWPCLLALLLVASFGCKAKVGEKCSGASECDGRDKALLCSSSKYVSAVCKGPEGCTQPPFRCDFRGNAGGDPCVDESDGHPMRCTADKKARVRCVGGKVDRDECDGPKGCYPKTETTILCDRALKVGAACGVDGDWCSTDGTAWLTCAGGKLVIASKCRGRAGCKPLADAIACDVSIAEVGDECVGSSRACSVDGTTLLSCAEGKFRLEKTCAAQGTSCRSSGEGASCERK